MKTEPNPAPKTYEHAKSAGEVWHDLDCHHREKALRILSDLCYAHFKSNADGDNDLASNYDVMNSKEIQE